MDTLKRVFYLFFILLNIFYAQGQGALAFTTIQQSPLLLGAGQIGVSIPNDEVLGFYFNPAILGFAARNNHASISFMPNKTEWRVPQAYGEHNGVFTFENYGMNLGFDLKHSGINLPIYIGIGYLHNILDYGQVPVPTDFSTTIMRGTENTYDKFNSFSLGVGINYYIKLHLGISLRTVEVKIVSGGVERTLLSNSSMYDFGTLVVIPISDLCMNNLKFTVNKSLRLRPTSSFSIGYSLTNVGEGIYFIDPAQTDPFSRTARLGYTFEIGTDLFLENTKLNVFKYSFSAEANDILVKLVPGNPQYQSGFGDINFSDHLINLKSDKDVIIHKGHILRFFDTIILTYGSFDGRGYNPTRKTDGFGFTSNGIFKILNNQIHNPILNYILEHFAVEYFNSNVEFSKKFQTNFDGLSIHFRGFEI